MENNPKLPSLPVIDITDPDWGKRLAGALAPNKASDCQFFCVGPAGMVARKKIPKDLVKVFSGIDDLVDNLLKEDKEETSEEGRSAAAVSGNIIVAPKYNRRVKDSTVWLSTYHLDLIKEILGSGFVIEVLDERGNLVKTLGGKND